MLIYLSHAADLLMIAASTGAAIYCLILSRRLSRLTSFDSGIGGAIAVLSAQIDEMKTALADAKAGTDGAGSQLRDLIGQARDISGELELMIAACHDFAEEALVVQTPPPEAPPPVPVAEASPGPVAPTPPVDDPVADAVPLFGTRRVAAPEPVFRRHAQG
jgi:hypothetical protein